MVSGLLHKGQEEAGLKQGFLSSYSTHDRKWFSVVI